MAAILNSANFNSAILDSTILVFPLKLTHICQDWFPPFAPENLTHTSLSTNCTKKLHSFILTQLDDCSHLEFCSAILESAILHIKKLHSFILTQLYDGSHLESTMLDSDTAILDSNTLLSSLRFTQKHSHSTLTLTHTNSIWLKLIHSHLPWWWQPS